MSLATAGNEGASYRSAAQAGIDWLAGAAMIGLIGVVPLLGAVPKSMSTYDFARMGQWAVATLCAIALLANPRPLAFRRTDWQPWVVVAAMLLALASVLGAPRTSWAIREAALLAGLLSIALFVGSFDRRKLRRLGLALVWVQAVYAFALLAYALLGIGAGVAPNPYRLTIGFENQRFFNNVQTVGLPLIAMIAASTSSASLKALAHATLAMQFALLYFLVGRSTMLALTLSSALLVVLYGKAAWPYLRELGAGALVALPLWALIFFGLPMLHGLQFDTADSLEVARLSSVAARLHLWGIAVDHIERSPFIGIGPMHFSDFSLRANTDAASPHNLYLQIAAEWGLPFAACVSALAVSGVMAFVRQVRRDVLHSPDSRSVAPSIGIGLSGVLVAMAIDALFSDAFDGPISMVWNALALGWCLAVWRLSPDHDPAPTEQIGPGRALAALLLALLVWLAADAAPEAVRISEYVKEAQARTGSLAAFPRFWLHGVFY